MWVITEKSDAVNPAAATYLMIGDAGRCRYSIRAYFPVSDAEDSIDYLTVKTFDNSKDAEAYITELAEKLNGEGVKNNVDNDRER